MPDYEDLLSRAYGNDPENAVQIAIEVYKDTGKYLKDIQAKAKKIVEEIVVETGRSEWKTQAGQVYFPKPSISVRYDAKALDVLCASDEALRAHLELHRIVTERAGSMTIK